MKMVLRNKRPQFATISVHRCRNPVQIARSTKIKALLHYYKLSRTYKHSCSPDFYKIITTVYGEYAYQLLFINVIMMGVGTMLFVVYYWGVALAGLYMQLVLLYIHHSLLGAFYVTPTTYHNLLVETRVGNNPILRPLLIYQTKTLRPFHNFASTMIRLNPCMGVLLSVTFCVFCTSDAAKEQHMKKVCSHRPTSVPLTNPDTPSGPSSIQALQGIATLPSTPSVTVEECGTTSLSLHWGVYGQAQKLVLDGRVVKVPLSSGSKDRMVECNLSTTSSGYY